MSRQDQYAVSVSINGKNYSIFDKMTGGVIDSEETKYKPGGMFPQISLGGSVTVTNVTVTRLFDLDRDLPLVGEIKALVGKGNVTVTKQALDIDGNPKGKPMVYTGKLKSATFPEVDSESNSAGMVALEVSSAGLVS